MIDKKTVEYVANLARVEVNEGEKDRLVSELRKIIGYINKLKELNVENVEPMRGAFREENILREDKAIEKTVFKAILKNAPLQEEDHFKIPKVIQ